MKKYKIILSGGGTGGHIFPAVALAEIFLSKKNQKIDIEILFVGAQGKMEMQLIADLGFKIIGLPIRGLDRKKWWKNLVLPYKIIQSLQQAKHILKIFEPDIVIGTGGYASVPIIYAAAKKKIPTLIQEQNVFPGLANRVLSRFSDKVCVGFQEASFFFPQEKVEYTGNPLRHSITQDDIQVYQKAYCAFGLDPQKKCLLVLGGSLGAGAINEVILKNISFFSTKGIQLIWQTGSYFYTMHKKKIGPYGEWIQMYPFIKNMAQAYFAADVVVARAGALTIAEICHFQKPSILIPSPHVTADHQTKNAFVLLKKRAAIVLRQSHMEKELMIAIQTLLTDDQIKAQMKENLVALAKPRAGEEIVDLAFAMMKNIPN